MLYVLDIASPFVYHLCIISTLASRCVEGGPEITCTATCSQMRAPTAATSSYSGSSGFNKLPPKAQFRKYTRELIYQKHESHTISPCCDHFGIHNLGERTIGTISTLNLTNERTVYKVRVCYLDTRRPKAWAEGLW